MDTLQEHEVTLISPVPIISSVSLNRSEAKSESSRPLQSLRGAKNMLSKTTLPVLETDANYQERFGLHFVDEQFKVVDVPYSSIKRFFDMSLSLIMIILLSVPMLITALVVKLTSKGPIIFRQARVGQGGRYFYCLKFRSMCIDAEEQKEQLMHLNEASGPVFKIKKDPRITPVGSFIRKFSIDELPQLFNILRGDMSIVGPRPPIPNEVAEYGEFERQRLSVRPGLTCLWQIGGRSNVSFERWVELDVEYIQSMSFKNDVLIVLKTIPVVLKGSGAH